jgi:hypothetical protein
VFASFAACGGATSSMMAVGECGGVCPPCGAGTRCIGERAGSAYRPVCVRTCASQSECDAGQRCALISGEGDGAVCVSASLPAACAGDGWSCTLADARCDGATLLRPFTETANFTCGYERVACANGCVEPPGATARCQ